MGNVWAWPGVGPGGGLAPLGPEPGPVQAWARVPGPAWLGPSLFIGTYKKSHKIHKEIHRKFNGEIHGTKNHTEIHGMINSWRNSQVRNITGKQIH